MTLGPRRTFRGNTPLSLVGTVRRRAAGPYAYDNVAARAVKTVWTVFRGARDSRARAGAKSIFRRLRPATAAAAPPTPDDAADRPTDRPTTAAAAAQMALDAPRRLTQRS